MKLSAPVIRSRKRRHGAAPLVMITAYDEPGARFASSSGVDLILVGDSVGDNVLGQANTLNVTMDDMVHHVRAVAAAKVDTHVVADLPWLSYHFGPNEAVANAARLIRAGADSVKLEGGRVRRDVVRAILDAEIPVMGHLGLTPQSVMAFGGFKVQAKTREAAEQLALDAKVLQDEGVYAVVVEGVPSVVGTRVTEALDIPTIGIGAGPDTDGQVLVFHDVLGLGTRQPARFVRRYADVGSVIVEAITRYAADVRAGEFPGPDEGYASPEELLG